MEPDDADPAEWLVDLEGSPAHLRLLAETVPPPSTRQVLIHNDLGAEHLLSDGTTVTGIIDWSDAALADPALDFARLYRDFGPSFVHQALQAYGGLDHSLPRIEYHARCAALEDLAFGLTTDRPEYADSARRSIAWLFPQ
ncbi:hypothetical protein GCM10009789_29100 [Kribbella sancticallisti]|uniref:Aminoglycoside phosphotransferase domain-containing protein n=1 Tax=Kribbella sancticallisti TaxID=460087 RepID=A0ABN2DDU0_9ACTN